MIFGTLLLLLYIELFTLKQLVSNELQRMVCTTYILTIFSVRITVKLIHLVLYFHSTAIAVFDSMNCTTRPGFVTCHCHTTDTIIRLILIMFKTNILKVTLRNTFLLFIFPFPKENINKILLDDNLICCSALIKTYDCIMIRFITNLNACEFIVL